MENLKEFRNTNKLYKRVVDEILEDAKSYNGKLKDRIITRCNEIVEHGCVSGTVQSLIYYEDTNNFYNEYYDEIYELIEKLEDEGFEPLEALKQNLTETQIILNDNIAKNQIAWLAYEAITNELLYIMED